MAISSRSKHEEEREREKEKVSEVMIDLEEHWWLNRHTMDYMQPQHQNMGICVFPLNQQLSYIFNFGMLRGSNPTSHGTLLLCVCVCE